jgi:ABC-type multidrug transport system ATPase subunit
MKVQNLSFRFKNNRTFFHGLNFELMEGCINALHGKNGTGKSLLLSLLADKIPLEAIMSGEVSVTGKVSLVNQKFDLMIADQFSFHDNLRFAGIRTFPSFFKNLKTKIDYLDLLKPYGIDMSLPVHLLSGGQRQILALMMIMQKPCKILLLDEPTATMDEQNAELVFDFLKSIAKLGTTLLVVCHDKELLERYTDGISILI